MEIGNIRLGFNNNSSSSHSIVQLFNCKPKDDYVKGEYGWDFFTLASEKAKNHYLATTLFSNLRYDFGEVFARIITKSITNINIQDSDYIDHQSFIKLPKSLVDGKLDVEFYKDLRTYLNRENIVILGGNDNVNTKHPLIERGKVLDFEYLYNGNLVCRNNGDFYTIIDTNTGNKIRVSFKDNISMGKTKYPESADIKVTNKCDKECSFCYQNSELNGMEVDNWYRLAYLIKDLQLMEVAIGGGEPTSCDNFAKKLDAIKIINPSLVITMTTGDKHWLKNIESGKGILNNLHSLAFSPYSSQDIIEFYMGIRNCGFYPSYRRYNDTIPVYINLVYGIKREYELKTMIETCKVLNLPVTILGFKYTGMGKNYKLENNDNLLKMLIDNEVPFGIDTVMANQWKNELEKLGVNKKLYYLKEGKYNIYLDMVDKRMGKSSFDELVDMGANLNTDEILKEYRKW